MNFGGYLEHWYGPKIVWKTIDDGWILNRDIIGPTGDVTSYTALGTRVRKMEV